VSFFVELTYSKAMDEVPGSGTSLSLGSVAILSATSFRSPISFGGCRDIRCFRNAGLYRPDRSPLWLNDVLIMGVVCKVIWNGGK